MAAAVRPRHNPSLRIAGGMACAALLVMLGGCNRSTSEPSVPDDNRPLPKVASTAVDEVYAGVTPMPQRVAVLGLLNKRNGLVRDISLKPGESIRIGRAVVRVRACERTAQWEMPQETGAFVQLIVLDHGSAQWRRVFSGWLFKDRPDRNIIQHPIYDVFVRSCTMAWPGELPVSDAPARAATAAPAASSASSAPQSPDAAPAATTPPAAAPAAAPATPATAP